MQRQQRKITHFFRGIGVSLARLRPIAQRPSPFRAIRLFQHPELGKVFVLGDEIQHVEAWAPLYHEPLVHLPASFVETVEEVLILGGGTLFAAAEALKYKSVKRVVLIDRDPCVTETVARYYPHARKSLKDRRLIILHEHAYAALPRFRNEFDLVVNDGADLLAVEGRAKHRREGTVFSRLFTALKPCGVCADVIQRHVFDRHGILLTINRLSRRRRVALSLMFVPEYHGVLHVLSIWGGTNSLVTQRRIRPANVEQISWMRAPKLCPCVYYDPRFLQYYFYLPRYVRDAIGIRRTDA